MKDWIVTYVDGKIASVTRDFKAFADIARAVAQMPSSSAPSEMHSGRITTDELLMMATTLRWEDLRLFGTKFQKSVWKQLFDLVHGPEGTYHPPLGLYSYSDFASICSNPGVRSVAHAVALNPVTFVIPCHLIVPKETIDKINEIEAGAKDSLFKGEDLYLLDTIDVGQYSAGSPDLKRWFIAAQLG